MFDIPALSPDAQVILMACSSLGAPRDDPAKPLGPRTWAAVARRLEDERRTPGDLLGMDAAAIATVVRDAVDAPRLGRLLRRGGPLAVELDRILARGLWVVTQADDGYPERLRDRLGPDAPPLLFGAGDRGLLSSGGVAIVGSRDVSEDGLSYASALAAAAARGATQVVSGGAKGVDQAAMRGAAGAGGAVVAVLPEGVERRIRDAETRSMLAEGQGVAISPYHPSAGFSAGAAMARNKLIYALSDVAVVVATSARTGGTWTGAAEALEADWVPVLVRVDGAVPSGNRELLALGARPLPSGAAPPDLTAEWLISAAGPPRARVAEAAAPYVQESMSLVD
ncbi:MAG TPA: DNA-processing protein DprA [Candidatus Limnocylindrales bacterium]|nr:DNA-processing protein DprA [Candidatus Limnocylindrales bacterium]